jgi:hypothetical protein
MDLQWPVDEAENTILTQKVLYFDNPGAAPPKHPDRRHTDPVPLCTNCHSSRVTPSRVRWYDYWQGPLRGESPFRCHTCLRRFWLARIVVASDRRTRRQDHERIYAAPARG